jgi:collagenase-like PrtC family protease
MDHTESPTRGTHTSLAENLAHGPASTPGPFGLTVGPVLYLWPRERLLAFYADIAESPADCVVLGEVVCARRRELRLEDWLALARELTQAGKQVILATQALVETEADLRLIERHGDLACHAVEAGDASALALLQGRVPLVLGPHINIYSQAALREHADLGVLRWVPPLELSLPAIACINPPLQPVQRPEGGAIATEVWAFGRLPLAFSARCFTARHAGVPKDQCGFPCLSDPDGRLVRSTEGQAFLVLNGTQTQSAGVHSLLEHRAALATCGASRVRLSPQSSGFLRVIEDFDAVLNREEPAAERWAAWADAGVPQPLVAGYAFGEPGMDAVSAKHPKVIA